jgi:putative membrane protein
MTPGLRHFAIRWAITTVAVLAATQIVPGLSVSSWPGLVVAALVLGLLNAFVRPLLTLLSLPLVVLTLGLFLWVINAVLLYFVAWLVKPFTIASFWSALGGAAVISITSWVLGALVGEERPPLAPGSPPPRRFHQWRGGPPPQAPRPPEGKGPVIDV